MSKYDKDEAKRLEFEIEKNIYETGESMDWENMDQNQREMCELDWPNDRFRPQAHMIGDLFSPPELVPKAIRGLEQRLRASSECRSCRYTWCRHYQAA